MATDLGKAYVQIIPSARGMKGMLESQINSEVPGAGISAGNLLGSSLVKTIGGVIAAAGIGKVIGAAITEGANLEQSIGGIETLFKNSAGKVKAYANEAYRTAGLSANEFMEQTTSFAASLLQSTAGNTEKAADIANMAMMDMSDNANKMGTNMQDIQNAYQGFAKQNYTMLDNLKLGYGGTKTEMERLLADAEKLTGIKYDIDNLSDVYEAIHAIQEELDITGTTALEASETFSGSFAAMKAAASNVLGKLTLGEDIKPSLKALAETTATFLFKNFIPMIGNILSGLPELISVFIAEAIPHLIEGGKGLIDSIRQGFSGGLPQLAITVTELVKNITTWITANLPSLLESGVKILTEIVNGILQSLPLLITAAGELISQFVTFIYLNLPTILQAGADLVMNIVTGIIDNLPAIAQSATDVVMKLIDTILEHGPKAISSGIQIVSKLIVGIIQKLPDIGIMAIKLMGEFLSKLLSKLPDIFSAGGKIIKSLNDGVNKIRQSVIDTFINLGRRIVSEVSNISLVKAGKSIMDSLLSGLKSSWSKVTNFVGGIGNWIRNNKGPIEYDRKLLIPAGKAIMQGLQRGLQENYGSVQSEVLSIADMITSTFENIETDFEGVKKVIRLETVVEEKDWNQAKLLNDSMTIRSNSMFNVNFKKENEDLLEFLSNIVDYLDDISNKEFASYLDGKEVSLGLLPHLENIERITKHRQAKITGERYV